jgi:methionyl-tRNA formyltransferase
LRIFIFGSSPHLDSVFKATAYHHIVGVCTPRPARLGFKERIARLIGSEKITTTPDQTKPPTIPKGVTRYFHDQLAELPQVLRDGKPDLVLCCGFPKLLPNEIISTAAHVINVHPGLLPERPGGTPVRWAVRMGDPTYGVTAHFMNERFDAGDIVYRKELKLYPNIGAGAAELALHNEITNAAKFVLRAINIGEPFQRTPQVDVKPMRSLRGKHQFIDWTKDDAASIRRLCLAMRPNTAALTRHGKHLIVLWDIEQVRGKNTTPGVVDHVNTDGPVIAAVGSHFVVHSALIGGKVCSGLDLGLMPGDQLY